jgi:misacylated tRNA(Ala) deacylase
MTERLFWQDDHCYEADATVVAVNENRVAFDRTCFYPGGGGQPCDTGTIQIGEQIGDVTSVFADDDSIWHITELHPVVGANVHLKINENRRKALARYHTVLHILNTIALRDYSAWITGVQINEDYSRIDFKFENFSKELCAELEKKVNVVIQAAHPLRSYFMPEAEFQKRTDLLRTLEVQPPVYNSQVRVVEIEGFDAQACGGTHLHTTAEIGMFSIYKTENKGKINKRLYVRI